MISKHINFISEIIDSRSYCNFKKNIQKDQCNKKFINEYFHNDQVGIN